MLAFALIAATAFAPTPTPALLVPAARVRSAPVQLNFEENAKAAGITSICGTIATAPVKAAALVASKAFKAQLAFSTFSIAAQLAVFGILYRYIVRCDSDDRVKQAVVFCFSLMRALSLTQCALQSDKSPDQWVQLGAYFGESALAFSAAAAALEYAFDRGWAGRLWYLQPDGFEEVSYGPDLYGRDPLRRDGFLRRGAFEREFEPLPPFEDVYEREALGARRRL